MSPEDIFINLTVLSKIAPGDKLIIENEHLLNIDISLIPSLSRWLRGISRLEVMQFISTVLKHAFELHDTEQNEQQLFRLTADLKNALTGLNNLKLTYQSDKLVQSEIDVMMENIRTRLYKH